MKEENSTGRKANSGANAPFDASDFIHNVALAGNREDKPATTQTESQAVIPAELSEANGERPAKRKRGQSADYENLFLSRNELRNRQGLYIGRENYESLQTLVRSIRGERLSVSGLVDNIVSHHIELYGDEMNRIYDENSRKPIKNRK